MNCQIREIKSEEYACMEEFLYEALFVPKGKSAFPRDIVYEPELQVYISDFGKKTDDFCLVAEIEQKIVGAAWVRIMMDYGHVDEDTPSLMIALYKEYRGVGIGTELLTKLLERLKEKGYQKVSLSSQKANKACDLYFKLGFHVLFEKDEEYIMVKYL